MSRRRDTPDTTTVEPMRGFDDYELRLGDIMRGERATKGKSLLDVQRDLKIRASYIAAIENADPSAFESPGFVSGYVRSYARYLGLDADWAYQTFCEEGQFVYSPDFTASAAKPSRSRGRGVQANSAPVRDPLQATLGLFHPGARKPLLRHPARRHRLCRRSRRADRRHRLWGLVGSAGGAEGPVHTC